MNGVDSIREVFSRIPPLVRDAVDGMGLDQLAWAPADGANTIGWLIWHLTRVHDDHVAEIIGVDQLWTTGEWAGRFGLEPDGSNTGYEHTTQQMLAVKPHEPSDLIHYHTAVADRTAEYLRELDDGDLDRVVDERYDPPVTVGVRLVSVADDGLQHVGQAAYLRGLLDR